jgi:4-hydroxy 2-oxovalerate aldolase
MELGYKASGRIYSRGECGAWKFCGEDDIRRVLGDMPAGPVLCVMADAERTDYHTDILPRSQSAIGCVRVATYIHQLPTALDMIKDAHDKGYETAVNLMAVSTVREGDLGEAMEQFITSPVEAIYLVDSYGSFFPKQVRDMTVAFMTAVAGTGKEIGIHAHNNQQLAFANTMDAMIYGANRLDATINGLGRGAGNCPLELLLGFLKNPRFDLRPILAIIEQRFAGLREKMKWGYDIPYLLTGQMNLHPRSAIEMVEGPAPREYTKFYDRLTGEES